MDMKRLPYYVGCKPFLASMNIGEELQVPEGFKYYSMKSVASRIYKDYGCRYSFRQHGGNIYVRRLS